MHYYNRSIYVCIPVALLYLISRGDYLWFLRYDPLLLSILRLK